MKNQPGTIKNHEKPTWNHENMKNHEKRWKTKTIQHHPKNRTLSS